MDSYTLVRLNWKGRESINSYRHGWIGHTTKHVPASDGWVWVMWPYKQTFLDDAKKRMIYEQRLYMEPKEFLETF